MDKNEKTRKLIALGEIISKTVEAADGGKIDSAKFEEFDTLISLAAREIKNRNVRKTEKIVKSILTDILLYHETRAEFIMKNHLR